MKPASILCALVIWLGPAAAAAQIGELGGNQNPPGIEWRVIETPHFEIIFPKEIENDAERVANTLEHVYPHVSKTLKTRPGRVSVILQNQLSESNGFMTFFPRHLEFFNTPPQEMGMNMDWYGLLSIHEFRHLVQLDKLNQRFTRFMYYLTGSYSQVLSFMSTPGWFWEGDAVATETALSDSGRGRQPFFDVEFRSLLLSGKRYPYYKAMFGSYKDWDPLASPYLLGYYLTAHVRRNYGADAWPKILNRATSLPFFPHWFSLAMKKKIGRGAPRNYEETLDELETLWRKQIDGLRITDSRLLHKVNHKTWTYNLGPQYTGSGKIVVLRAGMEDIFQFVLIDPETGKEKKLIHLGQPNSTLYSVGGDKIVWTESQYDPRWSYRGYSVIKIFDIAKGTKRSLTRKSRFFAPAVSPDMKRVATVEFNTRNQCSLVILDAETGREINRFLNPENEFLLTPRWLPDSKFLLAVKSHPGRGKALARWDADDGREEEVIPYTQMDINNPVSDGRYIYFVSSHSGIDNIYAWEMETQKISQVSSKKFGAYSPSPSADGQKLLFNDVDQYGYMAVEAAVRPEEWVPLEKVEDRNVRYYEPLVTQEAGRDVLADVPQTKYETKKYHAATHLLNLYAWFPFADPVSKDLSLTLSSFNLLGTMQTSLGYVRNWNEKTNSVFLNSSYAGWYPILDFGGSYGERTSNFTEANRTKFYSWDESSLIGGLRVPWNLTRGLYTTILQAGVQARYQYISDRGYGTEDGYITDKNGSVFPLTYTFSFFRGYSWAKDLYPVWGQGLNISYTHTPFPGNTYSGTMFSAAGTLFFPGLLNHHSLFLELGYENQRAGNDYFYLSELLFARGYLSRIHRDLYKVSANYTLPLFYPDLGIRHLLYSKRFQTNFFYDYVEGKDWGRKHVYRSAGIELSNDCYFFSWELPLRLGARFSYLIETGNYDVGLILALPMAY